MSIPRKKLIEVSIPLEAINVASAREKSIRHGHPSTLHLWWARRPLAACRAVLFAQLVDDPSGWPERFPTEAAQDLERRRLHKVIADMMSWEASNDEGVLNAARWEIARSIAWGRAEEPPAKDDTKAIVDYLQTNGPPVYDPFSGGGSIPLEAQRLGLRAYGSDLNPVAVLIGKALIEIPPVFSGQCAINPKARQEAQHGQLRPWKGAQGLAEDVRYYGEWMRNEAEKRIGHLYPKAVLTDGSEASVVAWLWARTVRSPDPAAKGAMVPLVSSFMLSTKVGKKVWIEPVIEGPAQDGWRFEVKTGNPSKAIEERLKAGTKSGRGTNFTCVLSGATISPDYVRSEGLAQRLGTRLMAIVAEGKRSRFYLSPTLEHEQLAASARPQETSAIAVDMPNNPRWFSPPGYGMAQYVDLFTPRQLVALTTYSDLVMEARAQALLDACAGGLKADGERLHAAGTGADAYADAIATYLGFALSKLSAAQSAIGVWKPSMEQSIAAFGRQAIAMTWDFPESNVFGDAAGDIRTTIRNMMRVLDGHLLGRPGHINHTDATKNNYPLRPITISSDPPYYDNIGYADLSDFFYVWLRRSLSQIWPELFRRLTTPKSEELVATPYRHGGKEAAEAFFMQGMSQALTAMRKAATDEEPLTIYYAFKQSEAAADGITSAGWASFLQAVVDAGLVVDGTWPVRTELVTALKAGDNALASSIVLVCRKRAVDAPVTTRSDFIRGLRQELPGAIDDIRKAGVGPVDMQQSIIGPGMGVFSRHATVLEDDDTAMPVKRALALINRVWEEIDQELDAAFDAETQVALAWYGTYGFDIRPSGEMIGLANAKNVSDRALFESGVFKNMQGKTALTPRDELPAGWSPVADKTVTVWECVQHAVRALSAEDGGAAVAAHLVRDMGARATDARTLAYRLFEIATRKGWAAEALVYNELAQEWVHLEDLAQGIGTPLGAAGDPQGTLI